MRWEIDGYAKADPVDRSLDKPVALCFIGKAYRHPITVIHLWTRTIPWASGTMFHDDPRSPIAEPILEPGGRTA